MKRWVLLVAAGLMSASSMGCLVPAIGWSPDPSIRAQQLIGLSEQLRQSTNDISGVLLYNQLSSNLNLIPGGGVTPP
jgi:hypothetical protein